MITQSISIRLATPEDAEMIADVSRRTFYDTFAKDNTRKDMEIFLNEQFTKELLMREVGISSNIFLLAFAGKKLAGYAKLREGEEPKELNQLNAIEIARFYAVREMIGKGVGKELMQHCIDLAKQKNKEVIWLAVWEKNHRAMDFYAKWGFENFGNQFFLLGTDLQKDLMMKKRL